MAEEKALGPLRLLAILAVAALFVADYVFDIMAKTPPVWAYAILGLLALGVELPALRRLVLSAVRVMARIPEENQTQRKGPEE